MRRAVLVVPFALLAVAHAQLPNEGEKFALLIGVQHYAEANGGLNDLKNSENDVTKLADILRKAGYRRVVLLTRSAAREGRDPTLAPLAANFRRQLDTALAAAQPRDTVVVGFAGHGVEPKGASGLHLCAEDSKLGDPKSMIALVDVYESLKTCKAGAKVLIADARRDDSEMSRPQRPPEGVIGLFGCSPGQRKFESKRLEHGYLFHALIEGLSGAAKDKDGNVDLLRLAAYAMEKVPERVREDHGPSAVQQPHLIGEFRGKVTLVKPAGPVGVADTGSTQTREEADWLVTFHNEKRKEVGVGPVKWSADVAKFAQAYADEIARTGTVEHNPNAQGKYGENLHWGIVPGGEHDAVRGGGAGWYAEKAKYTPGTPIKADESLKDVGHYTQMVWRDTTEIGAGKARIAAGQYQGWTVIVCNYSPPGNVVGRTPY